MLIALFAMVQLDPGAVNGGIISRAANASYLQNSELTFNMIILFNNQQ